MNENKLTEIEFWDTYWAKYELPCKVNPYFSFDRCVSIELKKILLNKKGNILEIGSAPGKWLAYLNKEIGLIPSGIEYSSIGNIKTLENFKLQGIPKFGNFWNGDFLTLQPSQQFDIVMSLGFIEHFENAEQIIQQQLFWLNQTGLLIVGIPNFKGIYFFIQNILDRSLLEKHNLSIMNLKFFKNIAKKNDLEIVFLNYIGGFEPALPIPKEKSTSFQQLTIKILLLILGKIRKIKFFDKVNNRYISSYIFCVYKKL